MMSTEAQFINVYLNIWTVAKSSPWLQLYIQWHWPMSCVVYLDDIVIAELRISLWRHLVEISTDLKSNYSPNDTDGKCNNELDCSLHSYEIHNFKY